MCGPAEEGGSQPPLLIGIISGALKSTQTLSHPQRFWFHWSGVQADGVRSFQGDSDVQPRSKTTNLKVLVNACSGSDAIGRFWNIYFL